MTQRSPYKTRKQIEIPKDDYEWFLLRHPGASLSWLMTLLLHSYRTVCEDKGSINRLDSLTPDKLTEIAAKDIREAISDGLYDPS